MSWIIKGEKWPAEECSSSFHFKVGFTLSFLNGRKISLILSGASGHGFTHLKSYLSLSKPITGLSDNLSTAGFITQPR